jgi:ornithine cyclodeaminase/alanine dehydrogenase-like protein (mu-crystallin family)
MRYLDGHEVKSKLSMKACINVMRDLFLLPPDQVLNPLRGKMVLPDGQGLMGMMPAYIRPFGVMGIKVLSVFPMNYLKGLSSHQGILHVFETETGNLLLSLDADEVTAIRTAAVSGLMTDLLAREDARVLGILGSGKQASMHLEAMLAVRPMTEVRVWSQNPDHAARFLKDHVDRYPVHFTIAHSAHGAAVGADVVCAATSATEPILGKQGLEPHVHINAVGACAANVRELEASLVQDCTVYVDDRLAASNEAGDILQALHEGQSFNDLVKGDIHEALTSPDPSVRSKRTLFKSVGIAIEDLAVGNYLLKRVP